MRKIIAFVLSMITMGAEAQLTAACKHDDTMLVRLAEIEVHPQYLTEYLAAATEIQQKSLAEEPGVLCLFPSRLIQKYKQGTLHMVKSLKLQDLSPLSIETMDMIFKRLK